MTHLPEVLEVMEGSDNPTSKKDKKLLRVLLALVISISFIFLLLLLASMFLFYKYLHCASESKADGRYRSIENINLSAESFNDIFRHKVTENVRLPRSIIPDRYKLKFVPFIWEGNFTFNGEVSIVVNVTDAVDKITLHALNLNISEWRVEKLPKWLVYDHVDNVQQISVSGTLYDVERQFFILLLDEPLQKDEQYRLNIRYTGHINEYLQGFYRSSYKVANETRWIGVTQFEATDARQAFPCFDEPSFKARFTLSIARPVAMNAISNMPIDVYGSRSDGLPPNFVMDTFKESVPMSTYLVAFAVTDFSSLSDNKKFQVWAKKASIDQAKYALQMGSKLLSFYEQFFRIGYPLPKIDMIAVPNFSSGAMENWGLITFREASMLYNEGVSTKYNKESVATVVAHELAHQWFGNLVTPEWWSDLWLNEGFATYMEYLSIDSIEPEWKKMYQFVVEEVQPVLSVDALISSHPISVEVTNPNEINEIFDGISYSKGASIIRMMDHFLTREVFKQGLTNYLQKKAYQNAIQDDLWSSLTEEAHRTGVLNRNISVKEIMDTWTLQTGFPLITVDRNYGKHSIIVTQSRFFINSEFNREDKSLWWVPLSYTTKQKRNFVDTIPSHWLGKKARIVINDANVAEDDWIIFNMQQTGYYRVNYDERNWQLLIETLNDPNNFHTMDSITRAQIINDAMTLAYAGYLKYTTALDLSLYLKHELDYIPWMAAFQVLEHLNEMLLKTPDYDKFKTYMTFLLSRPYGSVGFFETLDDNQLTIYQRVEVLGHACRLGFEDCIRNAVNQFQSWRFTAQPDVSNPISPNLKGIVYCTAIRFGGQREWDFAWKMYVKTSVESEKDILLSALGCTRETWILVRYLEWALNDTSGIKKQDVTRVFGAVSRNMIGQPLAWAILRDRWDYVTKYLGPLFFGFGNIVQTVLARVNTRHEINELVNFALDKKNETGSAHRAIIQSIEKARINLVWMEKNYDSIVAWLEKTIVKLDLL